MVHELKIGLLERILAALPVEWGECISFPAGALRVTIWRCPHLTAIVVFENKGKIFTMKRATPETSAAYDFQDLLFQKQSDGTFK